MVFATSNSSFSSFRAPVVYLARLATRNPIEIIVTTFCVVTLVYFQLIAVSHHLQEVSGCSRLGGLDVGCFEEGEMGEARATQHNKTNP